MDGLTIESYVRSDKGVLYCYVGYRNEANELLFSPGEWYETLDDNNLTEYAVLDNTGVPHTFDRVDSTLSNNFSNWFTEGTFYMANASDVFDNTLYWRGDFMRSQDNTMRFIHLVRNAPRPYDYVEITYNTPLGDTDVASGSLFRVITRTAPQPY